MKAGSRLPSCAPTTAQISHSHVFPPTTNPWLTICLRLLCDFLRLFFVKVADALEFSTMTPASLFSCFFAVWFSAFLPALHALHITRQNIDTFLNQQYDYIVVGGGISGLVVANRLSESDDSEWLDPCTLIMGGCC